jgi:cellulose biosynthesis protein BcsQ
MPAKIFCMASPKGGSGKTILTATFGAFLVGLGKKVLIIDVDAATNGLSLFHTKEVIAQDEIARKNNRVPLGIYELTYQTDLNLNTSKSEPEVIHLPNGVHLLPATYKQPLDFEKISKGEFAKNLSIFLEPNKYKYDYIFLDTQAGYSNLAKVCMKKGVADEIIMVSEWDPISNNGILRLYELLKEDLNPDRTWILYNKLLPDFAKAYRAYLEHIYSKELPPIPWDADVVKSYVLLKTSLDLEKGNEHTLAIIRIIERLLGDTISNDLNEWMKKKTEVIRQPIEEQYHQFESQLKENITSMSQLDREGKKTIYFKTLAYGLFFAALAFAMIFILLPKVNSVLFYAAADIATFAILAIIFFILPSRMEGSPEYQFERRKLLRQRSAIERRLNKLEALRTADQETLARTDGEYSN